MRILLDTSSVEYQSFGCLETYKKVIPDRFRAHLERVGFKRQKRMTNGSHETYEHPDGGHPVIVVKGCSNNAHAASVKKYLFISKYDEHKFLMETSQHYKKTYNNRIAEKTIEEESKRRAEEAELKRLEQQERFQKEIEETKRMNAEEAERRRLWKLKVEEEEQKRIENEKQNKPEKTLVETSEEMLVEETNETVEEEVKNNPKPLWNLSVEEALNEQRKKLELISNNQQRFEVTVESVTKRRIWVSEEDWIKAGEYGLVIAENDFEGYESEILSESDYRVTGVCEVSR